VNDETPFDVWLTAQLFEANLSDDCKREKWNGLYFLASDKQLNFAYSILERLILQDEQDMRYRLELQNASAEYCTEIIDEMLLEFERQTASFTPQKQFLYHCKLP
jgi:hypothetical protein